MKIHDEHVSADLFSEFVAHMPQVCVEVVVERDGGVLLAKRANEPAQEEWFWPGGRLLKGEKLDDAVNRIVRKTMRLPKGYACIS